MSDLKERPHLSLLQQKREDILAIAQKHGAKNVRIFGSVARGEAGKDSDIDFLIDYDLDKISPWFPAGLLLDLEALLGVRVDVATVDMLKARIKEQVLQEAIAL
ncbi:nucleotidyltransferase domain-containing protein [Limnothrix sp. FACHB-708]|uniref:nucleotidyltransferase family protein n=1 Tax=unclassified Limnothrix TaxID=2632864 RepID=UPI001683C34F|nr:MULTISPECIES: nucleotidyltransferase domain-containing protein [unclassified Limnothrix]MBD2555160.1 nucleotidyltransferase domain-containing protein [Limnothrix sp. FACHB-708]MBD2592586.1 nucleotidyltransferase domain-containing protein [Limnothrix sp. FACHB-406]